MLLEHWIINVQIGHIIIPLWVVWIKEHSLQWELWANSSNNVKKIQHLLNGLVSLLPHTSAIMYKRELEITYLWTGRLPSSTPRRAMVVKYLSIFKIII